MLKDLIGALILLLIGAGYYYLASDILLLIGAGYYYLASDINPSALDDEIGAAGLPKVYATLLAALALALAAKALIVWRFMRTDGKHPINDLEGEGRKLLRAAGMLGIGIAYVAVVTFSGYLISLAAVIALVALYQGERAGWRLARIAAGGGVAFWIFFDRVLGIDMPPGFWPALWGG